MDVLDAWLESIGLKESLDENLMMQKHKHETIEILKTFEKYKEYFPHVNSSPLRLAQNGFICMKECEDIWKKHFPDREIHTNFVACSECRLERVWLDDANPYEIHISYSPECPFVQKYKKVLEANKDKDVNINLYDKSMDVVFLHNKTDN